MLNFEKTLSVSELDSVKRSFTPLSTSQDLENSAKVDKVINYAVNTLGVTRIHPQEDPVQWPPPLGQNVHVPLTNCLRKRFQDIEDYSTQYELLINRAMIHKCTLNYCLNKMLRHEDLSFETSG